MTYRKPTPPPLAPLDVALTRRNLYVTLYAERFGRVPRRTPEYREATS